MPLGTGGSLRPNISSNKSSAVFSGCFDIFCKTGGLTGTSAGIGLYNFSVDFSGSSGTTSVRNAGWMGSGLLVGTTGLGSDEIASGSIGGIILGDVARSDLFLVSPEYWIDNRDILCSSRAADSP